MSIISEVKCARCDRTYSGVRSRCPYCGARRIGRGKFSEEGDNSKGKMLIGVLIMSVLVVATGVLLFTSSAQGDVDPGNDISTSQPPGLPDEDANTSVSSSIQVPPSQTPTISTPTSPSPPPEPEIRTVEIRYNGNLRTEFTAKVNEKVPLTVWIDPPGAEGEILWTSSNKSVFDVVPNDLEARRATVTGLKVGTETLTVSVGGVTAECTVRVRAG